MDTSASRSEIPGKFGYVVLEKDGEDGLDRSCEKLIVFHIVKKERSILHTYSVIRRTQMLAPPVKGKPGAPVHKEPSSSSGPILETKRLVLLNFGVIVKGAAWIYNSEYYNLK